MAEARGSANGSSGAGQSSSGGTGGSTGGEQGTNAPISTRRRTPKIHASDRASFGQGRRAAPRIAGHHLGPGRRTQALPFRSPSPRFPPSIPFHGRRPSSENPWPSSSIGSRAAAWRRRQSRWRAQRAIQRARSGGAQQHRAAGRQHDTAVKASLWSSLLVHWYRGSLLS